MADVKFNTKDFDEKVKNFENNATEGAKRGVLDVALEVLRLSQFQVPHDTGALQNTGQIQPTMPADEILVGYNKVYAARLHENPQFRFQKGRKGKYLEDPIKHNLHTFKRYIEGAIRQAL